MSKSADFSLLAGASGRAGRGWKEAVSLFNLGVSFDNSERFDEAINVSPAIFFLLATHSLFLCVSLNHLVLLCLVTVVH